MQTLDTVWRHCPWCQHRAGPEPMDVMKSRLTPRRDPAYPTCALTYATLRIYSDTVPPEAMSAKLGLEPQKTMTKGRPQELPSGRTRVPTVNGWFLSSKGHIASKDLRDHLDRLRPATA